MFTNNKAASWLIHKEEEEKEKLLSVHGSQAGINAKKMQRVLDWKQREKLLLQKEKLTGDVLGHPLKPTPPN